MDLSNRLRQVRKDYELNLREVHEETGVSVSYLSDLERGKGNNPSVDTLQKLAECYDMTLGELMKDVGDGEPSVGDFPPALQKLVEEVEEITKDDARDLSRIEFRGKRPSTQDEWKSLYYDLKRMMGDE